MISTHVPIADPYATISAPPIHIHPGGSLRLRRLLMVASDDHDGSPHTVEGTVAVDSALFWGEFDIASDGRLTIHNGYLGSDWRRPPPDRATISNHGIVLAVHSVFLAPESLPIVHTRPGGQTIFAASGIDHLGAPAPNTDCTGEPAVSLGYNLTAGCGLSAIGDRERPPVIVDHTLITDQIPVGTLGCGTNVDVAGDPRPVDFDQDGVAACDIGPAEHQPDFASWSAATAHPRNLTG